MSDSIEQKCLSKGVKLTELRKIIVRVLSESKVEYGESDHPDVEEFIKWKVTEEQKVAALVTGSKLCSKHLKQVMCCWHYC